MKNMYTYMLFLLSFMTSIVMYGQQEIEAQGDATQLEVVDGNVQEPLMQLFVYQDCPFCLKVFYFVLQNQDVFCDKIEFINADVPEHRQALQALSGRTQAPYLVDIAAGVSMPESHDIIAYLGKKFKIAPPVYQQIGIAHQEYDLHQQALYNSATFLDDVLASAKPVMVLVSATWCGPCTKLKPLFVDVASQMADVCEFIILDIDKNPEIAAQLKIDRIPTLLCYKHGHRIDLEYKRSIEGLRELVNTLLVL